MKRLAYILPLLAVACFLHVSCTTTPSHTPVAQTQYDSIFNYCLEKMHGAYYNNAGLPNQVVALDFYSEGLELTQKYGIIGTGTNLFFSDVFLSPKDSVLQDGEYASGILGEERTFLPGEYFEGNFTGAYLLLIADDKLQKYDLIREGTLSVSQAGSQTTISFSGTLFNGRPYHATYTGKLDCKDFRKQ